MYVSSGLVIDLLEIIAYVSRNIFFDYSGYSVKVKVNSLAPDFKDYRSRRHGTYVEGQIEASPCVIVKLLTVNKLYHTPTRSSGL